MNLTYERKLSRSLDNKAAVVTIPRAVAEAWERYSTVDMIFNGDCLIIKPRGDSE